MARMNEEDPDWCTNIRRDELYFVLRAEEESGGTRRMERCCQPEREIQRMVVNNGSLLLGIYVGCTHIIEIIVLYRIFISYLAHPHQGREMLHPKSQAILIAYLVRIDISVKINK